jgi:microcystin-dependent protein
MTTALGLKAPIANPTFTGVVTIPTGSSISGYAPLANPTFTGTVTLPTGTVTKAMVGLGNVDNTSDATLIDSPAMTTKYATNSDMTTKLALKANLANPVFTGTVGGLTKAMVGLDQVDNTSDMNKPISTAMTTKFADYYNKNTIKSMLNRSVPIGTIIAYSAATAPAGFVICDGGAYYRSGTYEKLFNVIADSYGNGTTGTTEAPGSQPALAYGGGSTYLKFNVPNIKSRTIVGVDTNKALTTTGGSENTTLFTENMPAHSHPVTVSENGTRQVGTWISGGGGKIFTTSSSNPLTAETLGLHSHTVTIGNTGSGTPFSIMQPYITLNYIIKYDDPSNVTEPAIVTENYTNTISSYFGVF